ncbi:MAG: DNA mismatch repair endonuclease MutL [Deltaproteobacteria bacterium]|nr:DNA mismatch repair endonuclease MutL [Deltaproteobacteria bacterium]
MSKVRILPEILSNKIAAGEVVERPASAVKELVENALDAGGSRILVEIGNGGKSLIRISDNGHGMNHDDALLAMERYATSKIYAEGDLYSIATLGFRGEALPSIASVSRFKLVSRDNASETGVEIDIEGGKIKRVSEVGAPVGTMVTVKNLFFNTPARRKFLKTRQTELSHIADLLTRMALAWPSLQLKFIHNQRIVKDWPAVSDPFDRVAEVIGQKTRHQFRRLETNQDELSLRGWISSPLEVRSTSRSIYIFVNGRSVHNRSIQHALFEGYRGRLVKGQFPLAVLFIGVPPNLVDVNVHPAKNEIRFAHPHKVHALIETTVRQTLDQTDRKGWSQGVPEYDKASVAESPVAYEPADHRPQKGGNGFLRPDASISEKIDRQPKPSAPTASRQTVLWAKRRYADLKVIGQIHSTYILCESDTELIIIDQHAAHERIVYEQLKKSAQNTIQASQKLLIPETLELGFQEAQIMVQLAPRLNRFGLEIEPFGGNSFVIKAIPALLVQDEIKPLVIQIVEKIAEIGFAPGLETAIEQSLMLMACHGTIRANQRLTDTQMKGLLRQLDECDHPSYCPHGRPTWITWTRATLEKAFKRIV